MLEIELSVDDLKKAQAKMEQMAADMKGPVGQPLWHAVRETILIIQRSAKQYAPVNTGRLRASIVPEIIVSQRPMALIGIVGSNVTYAPHVEFGTKPHWPPISALERWAELHGTSAYLVALGISRHGTKAIRYLGRAVDDNQHRIEMIWQAKAKIITDKEP